MSGTSPLTSAETGRSSTPPQLAWTITIVLWGGLLLAPFLVSEGDLYQITQLICYGLFAMSLAFAWGQAGLLCFGHALFFGVGAYVCALVSKGMLPGLGEMPWLGVLLGTLCGAIVAALLGLSLFVGRVVRGAFFGIITLCASVIADRVATNWNAIGGLNGILDIPPPALWGGHDMLSPWTGFWVMTAIAVVVATALGSLVAAPWGTVLRGIAADEVRVATYGYPVARHKVAAFGLSGAVAGLAGSLFAGQFGFVGPSTLGFALSTEVLIWVAVGGRQSLTAAFFGALTLKYLEGLLSDTLGQYWLLALGVLLMVIVMYFPRGLLGKLLGDTLPARLRTVD